jgi:MoxR-like ATPase
MNELELSQEAQIVEVQNVEEQIVENQSEIKVNNTTSGFVFMEDVGKVLNLAINTEENVILYGKGGYGKSEFTMEFLNELGIEPYVITMGSGMTTDRLFGGLDLQKFNETGKIEYLVENSFMNHEYVIFEELFDAPDFILEQLKDILSSGCFRNGNQLFPIQTRVIVCCTNKTRDEFAKNNSLKALMERFPLELEVKWDNHNRITYEKLLQTKLGFADPMLTYILEQYAMSGKIISPRIAIKASKIIAQSGPDSLNFIADFSSQPEVLKSSLAKFKSIFEIDDLVKTMQESIAKFDTIEFKSINDIKNGNKLNKSIYASILKLKGIKADDSLVQTTTDGIKQFTEVYERNKKALNLLISLEDNA